jgi:hypothetical protein
MTINLESLIYHKHRLEDVSLGIDFTEPAVGEIKIFSIKKYLKHDVSESKNILFLRKI